LEEIKENGGMVKKQSQSMISPAEIPNNFDVQALNKEEA